MADRTKVRLDIYGDDIRGYSWSARGEDFEVVPTQTVPYDSYESAQQDGERILNQIGAKRIDDHRRKDAEAEAAASA